jgi:hypothetical protein
MMNCLADVWTEFWTRRRKIRLIEGNAKMPSSKQLAGERDFVAGVYLSEAQNLP